MMEYVARLICLSLATYFVIQLASGLAIAMAARSITKAALRLRPRQAARALLLLRWTPAALGLFVVGAVCIPSYLWFEPGQTGEEIGLLCLTAAALALTIWTVAFVSGSRQVLRSRRLIRDFPRSSTPVMAIAGIRRSRLLVSPAVMAALTEEQLDAALRHEQAHVTARDNLKRLLLAFTPGLLPGINGFSEVQRQWVRLTEWAADDDAVAGDSHRALALASALISVARLGSASIPLASSMINGCDLTERIDRLLRPADPPPAEARPVAVTVTALALLVLAAMALRPPTLEAAHELLERLVN